MNSRNRRIIFAKMKRNLLPQDKTQQHLRQLNSGNGLRKVQAVQIYFLSLVGLGILNISRTYMSHCLWVVHDIESKEYHFYLIIF